MCVCTYVCRHATHPLPVGRPEVGIVLSLDPLLLTHHLSLNLELAVLTRLVSQKASDLPFSDCYHPAELRLQMFVTTSGFYIDFGDLNTGSHARSANTLPLSHFPSPSILSIKHASGF